MNIKQKMFQMDQEFYTRQLNKEMKKFLTQKLKDK